MSPVRTDLPTGTVTFLFSDIEGSTRLAHDLDTPTFRELLELHNELLRTAFSAHVGVERGTQGDSFLVIFRDPAAAVAAAVDVQRALAAARWPTGVEVRIRMGLHTGAGILGGDDYVGLDVNRAARIAAAAHGGQVLVSAATFALAGRGLPAGVAGRDLGEHRLRGLDLPERIHQLVIDELPSDFPPLRSLGSGESHLPARLTSFVGRRSDLDALQRILVESRLVTLTGPGGSGKTSLAIELAGEAEPEVRDGAWFVSLDTISDPDLVASAIVSALGLRDVSGRPAREQLLENLSDRSLLLILDNFEQVLDAAPLVAELLAAGPRVRVIVTSRAPLHLAGEQIYPVHPLELPGPPDPDDLDRLESVPSVRLLVDRARLIQPAFALSRENARPIAEICALLDGLPLGIELAAARIPILGAAGVRDRLVKRMSLPGAAARDMPTRHRTLREAIAWSHDLLDPATQALFARLSVFSGGWRLEQAEAVCGPDGDASQLGELALDVGDGLVALVEQSLVTATETSDAMRFGMLETIHDFAAQRLTDEGERSSLLRPHAAAYLALVEEGAPKLGGIDGITALERGSEDWANIRAAVRWSIETGETELALRFAASLWRYWWLRSELEVGRSTTQEILAMPGAEVPSTWRVRALEALGGLWYYSVEGEQATASYRAQLGLAQQIGDLGGIADALFNLAFTQDLRAPIAETDAMIEEIADAYRAAGDEQGLARTAFVRSNVLFGRGLHAEGRVLLEQAIVRFHELGDSMYEMLAASILGLVCLQMGDRHAASRWLLSSLRSNDLRGDAAGITVALPIIAVSALGLVGPEPAATIMGAYEALSRRYGIRMPRRLEQVIELQDPLGTARAALGPEDFEAATRRGAEMTRQEAVAFVVDTFAALESWPEVLSSIS